jgi:hypothetical protein
MCLGAVSSATTQDVARSLDQQLIHHNLATQGLMGTGTSRHVGFHELAEYLRCELYYEIQGSGTLVSLTISPVVQ